MVKKIYSTNSLPSADPVYVVSSSELLRVLDPKYLKVLDKVSDTSQLRTVFYPEPTSPTQFPETFVTAKGSGATGTTNSNGSSLAISLDDVFVSSPLSSYFEGTNKRYKIKFKIINSENLPISGILYKVTEV